MDVEITCGVNEKQFVGELISYNLEKKNSVKWLTLNAKQTKSNTRKKLSLTSYVIMPIFSRFEFALT